MALSCGRLLLWYLLFEIPADVKGQNYDGTTTTTGQGSMDRISGYLTVSGIDFYTLNDDSNLKSLFVDRCAETIADAANIARANVQITLFRGDTDSQVSVEYVLTVLPIASQATFDAFTAARNWDSLEAELLAAIASIPGINDVTFTDYDVTYISPPILNRNDSDDWDAMVGGALWVARPRSSLVKGLIFSVMALASAPPLFQRLD